jgi:pSer/pThr/pTyr-binding forkhead associated (FHA) protein
LSLCRESAHGEAFRPTGGRFPGSVGFGGMAGEQLRVSEGFAPGELLAVEGELLIGRAASVDAGRLGDDPELSRRHATVARGPGGELTIEDLGSANGTFVNGERVSEPRVLVAGDVVRLGQTQLAVEAGSEVPGPTKLTAGPVEELVVTEGWAMGVRLSLAEELVIGRAEEGPGRLNDDPELSRRHAVVKRLPSGLAIEDLGSANGTFVNGERIREAKPLVLGDTVRVGRTTMQLTVAGQEPTGASPAAASPAPASAPPPAAAPPRDRLRPRPVARAPLPRPLPTRFPRAR